MELTGILTQRNWEKRASFDLVYAWEDSFARNLGIPLRARNRMAEALVRRMPGKPSLPVRGNLLLMEMEPYVGRNVYNRNNVVPYWVDFFLHEDTLPALVRSYNACPFIFVSSREVFEFLENRGTSLPIRHLPLSLPDCFLDGGKEEKVFDLVMMGRPNEVLAGFFRQYVASHDCTYAWRKQENGRYRYYDQSGTCLGDMDTHEKYLSLMRKGRVGIYATPGTDSGSGRTAGFSPVTPRFLEYLSAGCHPVMRYKANADTAFYGLDSICPSVESYEEFETRVDSFLDRPADTDTYREYLSGHLTSVRLRRMIQILSQR